VTTPAEITASEFSEQHRLRRDPLRRVLTLPAGRWLVPSLSDLLFIALFVWLFIAGGDGLHGLLLDGDIGWHIRTGEWILDHRAVPHTDLFTFSKPGAPWFAWEWLSDVLFGAAHRAVGLKGVVMLAAVVIAAWPIVLLRHAFWRGAHVWIALGAVLLGVGGASIHFLARPHVFTLLFTAGAVWMIEADRRKPGPWVWSMVPLTILWTNLHGGFPVVVVLLALAAVGSAAERLWAGGPRGAGLRYATLAGACAASSLINPYGPLLHAHIYQYLRSDWIRSVVQEFQAPNFRSENLAQYEVLLFAALLLGGHLAARRRFVHVIWLVAFAHLSLTSIRHVPVFIAVVTPIVAASASEVWTALVERSGSRSTWRILDRVGLDLHPGFQRMSVWPALFLVTIWVVGGIHWPREFPAVHFPVAMVHQHRDVLAGGRVLTLDQWADYLIYENYPRQRVFADGRSDFLGPELGNEYLRTAQGGYGWSATLDKYRVDTVLAPVGWPLATILKSSPRWRVLADNGQAVLFGRIPR
jgi:hypothetical protein